MDKDIQILIGDKPVDLTSIEELPLTISYKLEDRQEFTKKQGSNALNITVPASLQNDLVANTFHNPSIEDLTTGQQFRSIQPAKITIAGQELLVGKAFLNQASHTDRPIDYSYDFYGNNSDWMIDLKDTTFYDFLKQISILFTKQKMIDSWQYDGISEALPYAFIPIRYGNPMDTFPSLQTGLDVEDYNMRPDYMKPSLSKFWIIYWAFKSLGYSIKSDFFNTPYFRRQLMPWTWGSFLESDGTQLDALKFLAKSESEQSVLNQSVTIIWDLKVTNDSINGAYDNSNTYSYVGGQEMRWTYPTTPASLNFGLLEAHLHLNVWVQAVATANSDVEMRVQWFKNGVRIPNGNDNGNGTLLMEIHAPAIGRRDFIGACEDFFFTTVNPGDYISAKIYLHTFTSGLGIARVHASVDAFEMEYFKIPLGGTINFANLLQLKNFKFLDFLGGVCDEFDLLFGTNSATKEVYIEPAHPYSTSNDLSVKQGGYFNGNWLDWSTRQDLSKKSTLEPFTDSERELLFEYKDDASDGTLKKIQDRNNTRVGQAKYVFPDRFAIGQKEIENRFFAPTMHYDVKQWIMGSSDAPQMIIMSPENISNLSAGEAQNTFTPKSIYYKGLTPDYKWVFDGAADQQYPFAFAVNYKAGGENDPILSYCDETIVNVQGKGLLRRFFLQRLAIMRDGQQYTTWFNLHNIDVANFLHREFIVCRGQKWEIVQLDYNPLKNESSKVFMRKWVPII